MMMKRNDIVKLLFLFIVSLVLAILVRKENINNLLAMLPNILGILLSGVLASLAIIFGLLSSNELALIYKRSKEVKNRDIYRDFLSQTEIDAKIIFSSLCFAILILVAYDVDLAFVNIPSWLFLGLGFFILFLSISSVYDIITSLFHLNQLRYELSTKIEKERRG
jgi:hypothetical protein